MGDKYQKTLNRHHEVVPEMEHQLLEIAQRLCPGGHWLLQVTAYREYVCSDKFGIRIERRLYHACAHNGDDNVTGVGKTVGAACADLIHHLLNGAVFPLTGNAGHFDRGAWEGDIEEAENAARQEGMKAAGEMAYKAARGATREACATICDRRAGALEYEAAYGDNAIAATITLGRATEAARLATIIRGEESTE